MSQLGTLLNRVVSSRISGVLALVALGACTFPTTQGPATSEDPSSTATVAPGSRALPGVRSAGGLTLAQPHAIPVFIGANDVREAAMTTFLDAMAGSDYWRATTAEYGVGDLVVDPAVHATGSLPAEMTHLDVKEWLASRFAAGTGFPALGPPGSIYVVFFPPRTVITAPWGTSCVDYRAYHGEFIAKSRRVAFAAIPRCSSGLSESELDALTRSVSHELIEAATDPFVDSHPAYALPDDRSMGWVLGAGAEVTDRCMYEPAAYGALVGGRSVARSWSNAAAATGHDPCVPAISGTYFNAEPIFPELLALRLGNGKTAARTITVHVGETRTIDVAPFADGPLAEFTLEAKDGSQLFGGDRELELDLDDGTAHPGEIRHLTIKRVRASATGSSAFLLWSHTKTAGHQWWGVVAN
jgi:hypothetical protein